MKMPFDYTVSEQFFQIIQNSFLVTEFENSLKITTLLKIFPKKMKKEL